MNRRQIITSAMLATLFTLTLLLGSLFGFKGAGAAPLGQSTATPTPGVVSPAVTRLSISAMAFLPLNQAAVYQKDVGQHLLTLGNKTTTTATDSDIFVAPLNLPNRSRLRGMTVFGQDFDNQGAVQVRLKRCDHSQARCLSLAEMTSTAPFAAGQFESSLVALPNEAVNNDFYSYFLELELTALAGSGLRSVRLELVADPTAATPAAVETWALSGAVTSFPLPNQDLAQVRICTDDLGHLPNSTHYPWLVVDGQTIPLLSNACIDVLGYTMQIRRELNTGSSSGTYQFLHKSR